MHAEHSKLAKVQTIPRECSNGRFPPSLPSKRPFQTGREIAMPCGFQKRFHFTCMHQERMETAYGTELYWAKCAHPFVLGIVTERSMMRSLYEVECMLQAKRSENVYTRHDRELPFVSESCYHDTSSSVWVRICAQL